MTLTRIPAAEPISRLTADIAAAREAATRVAAAETPDGSPLAVTLTIHAGSKTGVDAIAAGWGVPARWNDDRTRYCAYASTWPVRVTADYIPPAPVLVPIRAEGEAVA